MTIKCVECDKDFDVPVREGDLDKWKSGGLLQKVMPYLTEAQRELLISQVCGKCFDELFEELDADDPARGEDDEAPAF